MTMTGEKKSNGKIRNKRHKDFFDEKQNIKRRKLDGC